jgi:MFS family permease
VAPVGSRRRSIRAAATEGAASDVVTALATGAVLTGWSLRFGGSPGYIAAVQSLWVGAQVLHLPASILTMLARRKRLAMAALALSRLAWLPMALSPWLGWSESEGRTWLFATAACGASLNVIGVNAQTSWMGDLVPASIRGRFFAQRTLSATVGNALGSLGAAVLMDRVGGGAPPSWALPTLAGAIVLAGLVTSALLFVQDDAPARAHDTRHALAELRRALVDRRMRPLFAYQLYYWAACAPGAGLFALWVLDHLGAGYTVIAMHALFLTWVRLRTAPLWGRAIDRFGARPVLVVCTAGIGLMPLLWTLARPDFLWPLVLDSALSGALWGGHAIAMFDLPLGLSDHDEPSPLARPAVVAWSAAAMGTAWIAASVLARLYVGTGEVEASTLRVVFYASAFGRGSAALLALRLYERQARTITSMIRGSLVSERPEA